MSRKTEFAVSLLIVEDGKARHVEERVRTSAGYRRAGELALAAARKAYPGASVGLFGPGLAPAVRRTNAAG